MKKAIYSEPNRLAEDRELSQRISRLTALRDKLPVTELGSRQKLSQEIQEIQQWRNTIEAELKRTALDRYVSPEFRRPMDMARELAPQTAVLQYSVGEKRSWLLVMTRDGFSAHHLGAKTSALPKLLPQEEVTYGQLLKAWAKYPEQIGLDGLVRLARVRIEDMGKRTEQRHNLVSAILEQAVLERLGEVVLPEPALSELRQKNIRKLLIIPNGSLHYVPFAMLRVKGRAEWHYLVEEFSINYIPAMTTMETIRKQKQEREKNRQGERRSLLAFANPAYGSLPELPDDMTTLAYLRSFRRDYYSDGGLRFTAIPYTEYEALEVASLFAPVEHYVLPTADEPKGEAVVYTGRGACEEQVKRLLSGIDDVLGWRYILFSTHALADPQNGMLSCIALSSQSPDSEEDGLLQAQEVINLQLDTEMVMLSACQTGLGRMRRGEGLIGMSTAFFHAGAESVCASLWSVPSGPTSQLVLVFFRKLSDGKLDKAESLRQAQLEVMRSGRNPEGRSSQRHSPECSKYVI